MSRFHVGAAALASFWMTASLLAAAEASGKPVVVLAEAKVMAVCQSCHGQSGDSVSPIYPRLNGQQADYLAAQLMAFRARGRDDTHARGYMWSVARGLDDTTIAALGRYYASQKPTQPQTGGALAAEGERLFLTGDVARGVAACQQCHGKNGDGNGLFPRIAGQHASYFRMVMGAFRSGLRRNDVMGAVANKLSDREIEALASYLSND